MKKNSLYLFLFLVLVLFSACSGGQEPTPTETNPPPTPESTPQPAAAAQCTVQSQVVPEPAQTGDHITGAQENYSVTIINYNDFTCEGCATIAAALAQAVDLYPDDIRLIYRYYTSPAKNPIVAARAVEAAGNQGKYTEMYQLFFNNDEPWVDLSEQALNDYIWEQVTTLGLDENQIFSDMNSQEIADLVQEHYTEAVEFLDLLRLGIHADRIAAAAEAAGQQNLFWQMYRQILATQEDWQDLDTQSFDEFLLDQANLLQLDPTQFQQDFESLTNPGNQAAAYDRAIKYFSLFYRTPIGMAAAKAAEAAGLQGKFWEIHDLLFANQSMWTEMNEQELLSFIASQFETLAMDEEQFTNDYYSQAIDQKILADYLDARAFETPAPVVSVNGSVTPPYLTTVGDFLLWLDNLIIPYYRHIRDNQFYECPEMTIDTDSQYTATLHTDKGDIVLALYPEAAPFAVNSFIFLAEHDYYDNTPFYAVIDGFVAQAGDPSGTGWGTPGFLYDIETSALTFDRPYMVAMANSGPGSNNSQFFITFSTLSYLNGQNTIFGEVIDGLDVLKSLNLRDPESDPYAPMENTILDISIEEQ